MSAVPQELKSIQSFLQRAREIETTDAIVAYYCKYYALQQAIALPDKSQEATQYLLGLMTELEQSKQLLKEHEAINNNEVAKAYLEAFALKLFLRADNADRAGKADK